MTKQEIKEQLLIKQQELKALLEKNNLNVSTALTTKQMTIVEQSYKVLGMDMALFIKKRTFEQELLYYIGECKGALQQMKELDDPILPSKLKEDLKVTLNVNTFLINRHIYDIIASALPNKVIPRRKVAQQVIGKLSIFTKDYILSVYKKNKPLRQELKKYKTLSKVLPSKELFIACFTNENVEDKANKDHPKYQALEKSYTDKISKWLVSVADSLESYSGKGKIDKSILKGELATALTMSKYDTFVKFELVSLIDSCLAQITEQEATEDAIIALFKTKFKGISTESIRTYFDYQLYKAYTENNFEDMVGTVLPTDVTFTDAFKAAAKGNVNNDPDYLAFRKEYQVWAEKIIQTINTISNTDTLFHATDIMSGSKDIGENSIAAKNLSEYVYNLASERTKGVLLKEFIAKVTGQINRLAGKPDELVFEEWKGEQFTFPLDYPTKLKTLLEESMAKASFTEYSAKIDDWATSSMDMIKEIGDNNSRLTRKSYYSKILAKELAFLFGKDIDGIEGVRFIYDNHLGPKLNAHATETIRLSEIQNYWKDALENAQSNPVLNEQYYQNIITTYNPKEIENFIDSLEFIFPASIDVETVIKKCAVKEKSTPKPPVKELNSSNPNTLMVQYTLNWENRKTLLEIVAKDGVVNEVPIASGLQSLKESILEGIDGGVRSILPEWGTSTLDELTEGAGDVLSATMRTEVPDDVVNISIPLKVNKQYNAGKEVVFLDIDALTLGYIGFNKQSPYTITRVSFNKVGKTEFRGQTAIHRIVAAVDVDDLALSKAIQGGVVAVGGSVSSSQGGARYTFVFNMEVVSTFNNDQLSATVRNATTNTSNCPLLEESVSTANEVQNFRAFQ